MSAPIPFNKSSQQGKELDYIRQSIFNGQVAGDQTFSKKCQSLLEDTLGVQKALITSSCTHALEMAAILLNIQPNDEVIIPAFTFVSTANAFVLHGAHPVFCDIRADTLNLDESKLESLITKQTRAIVVVHYAGVSCEMDKILEIANHHGIAVVEDNAHGLFGKYRGRWLGTFGCLATQSFHETKNITCGEGGTLLINNEKFIERAEIIREKGTNRARFFRGQVDKYSWVDVGSSYVMSDILAAFLYGQLEKWQEIQKKRINIWKRYHEELSDWADQNGVRQPAVPEHCDQPYHMYYLLMPSGECRSKFIARLKDKGVMAVFHYLPLNSSNFALQMAEKGWQKFQCPVTEDVSKRIVRLPFYADLSEDDQTRVIDSIKIEFNSFKFL
ncbi:MAG: dTDP-4-amino-4,6-dideoxygalactose transaminase [Verrucomicrobia bacterium]|nr:dTDP-4-amino-4,6-dideoxygalactose transaminase [Verrucomicrobiota bacterium]